jgi:hypothetical protein
MAALPAVRAAAGRGIRQSGGLPAVPPDPEWQCDRKVLRMLIHEQGIWRFLGV